VIAIFSDVHSNHDALDAVYTYLRRTLRIRRYWFLGDLIGYGPDPVQTFKLIAEVIKPEIWLAGNHDCYISPKDPLKPRDGEQLLRGPQYIDGIQVEGPRYEAWSVDMRHRDVLDDDILCQLAMLKHAVTYKESVYVTHAVYSDTNDIFTQLEKTVKVPADFDAFFDQPNAPWHTHPRHLPYIHIGGHSHYTSFWKRPLAGGTWEAISYEPIAYDVPYSFESGYFYYINPGSIGFPRNNKPCPSVALFDEKANTITFHAFTDICYNSEKVRARMIEQGYPESVWSEVQFQPCILTQCND